MLIISPTIWCRRMDEMGAQVDGLDRALCELVYQQQQESEASVRRVANFVDQSRHSPAK